jgi:hypothetical protein
MKKKAGELKIETLKLWIEESIDIDYYDLMWTQALIQIGDAAAIEAAMENKVLARSSVGDARPGKELPFYPEILPMLGKVGLQNHGLVNARINVQGLTLTPELEFRHSNNYVREYNRAFFLERWTTQMWDQHWYQAGIELEANGIASCRAGVTDGRVDWRHTQNLDSIWDRTKRSPAHWRWVCDRDRLCPEDVEDIYGDALSDSEIEQLTRKNIEYRHKSAGAADHSPPVRQIVEWQFYSKDHHVVFLGSIFGEESIALVWDPGKGSYKKAEGGLAGPNPWGVIPKAFWIDSWAANVKRPVSKVDTTMRAAAILNEVEEYLVEHLRESAPKTVVDASAISPEDADLIEKIKAKDVSFKNLKKVWLTNGTDIKDVLQQTPVRELPQVVIALRAILKEEINASTGVQDMQRGQALTGERRTREEIRTLNDAAGVQARHLRETFASFLCWVVYVTRAIATQFDTAETRLQLESYPEVTTSEVPVKTMLGIDMPVQIEPNSLAFKSLEEKKQEAAAEFLTLHQPYIQLGQIDPRKSFIYTFRKMGIRNPVEELGVDPQQPPQGMAGGAGMALPGQGPVADQQPEAAGVA